MNVALSPAVRPRLLLALAVVSSLLLLSAWLVAAQHDGPPPAGAFTPRKVATITLTGPDADQRRTDLLQRAAFRLTPDALAQLPAALPLPDAGDTLECRFLNEPPSGTTSKFNCVLANGDLIKVKYGRNPEIQGETLATALLRRLGFAADDVRIVRRVRCHGCPRAPFATAIALSLTSSAHLLGPAGHPSGYSDFEWVSIERKFPAAAIETANREGWAWWELRQLRASPADVGAIRLIAIFMAHWDNKASNQRLVCLDRAPASDDCQHPLAMMQDLGATFGPTKVNLGRWQTVPIWRDRARCEVSMRALPWNGGTFPDARIPEAARLQMVAALDGLSNEELSGLFRSARIPEYQSSTADERDLTEWVRVFRAKTHEIAAAGPCPES